MAAPETMRAEVIDKFGDPLQLRDIPVPHVGPQDVLIRLHAAGVAEWDPVERNGGMVELMDHEPSFPYVIGTDGAGEVVAVGDTVERFVPGDRVWAVKFLGEGGGFYAEYAVAPQDNVAPIPAGLSMEQAGALPSDAVTALCGLDTLDLQKGARIAIAGASGGVGHVAVQFAKRLGLHVLAVASGDDGVQLVRDLGADASVDGKADGLADAIAHFAPGGLDAALMYANGSGLNVIAANIRDGGRLAYPHGVEPAPTPPDGVDLRVFDGVPTRELLERIIDLIEAAPFRVHVAKSFMLADAAQAQQALEDHYVGKLILTPAAG